MSVATDSQVQLARPTESGGWTKMEFSAVLGAPLVCVEGRNNLPAQLHGAIGRELFRMGDSRLREVFERADREPPSMVLIPPARPPRGIFLPETELGFGIVLLGVSSRFARPVAEAVIRAGQNGFAERNAAGKRPGYRLKSISVRKECPKVPPPDWLTEGASIRFTTPMCAKEDLRSWSFSDFWKAVRIRVVRHVGRLYGPLLDQPSCSREHEYSVAAIRRDLAWETWAHHVDPNDTMRSAFAVTGMVGQIDFRGDLRPYWQHLSMASAAGVGSHTSIGCGRIELVPLCA